MPPVKGKMLNYPEEQMNLAVDAVRKGMPVATAAKRFSVPRITLMYKAKGKTPQHRRMGPDTVLKKEEENLLVQWILTMAKAGFPLTKTELLDSVQHLIQELKRKNPFVHNRPGKTWYNAFIKRHPNIGIRMAQNLTSSRAAVKEEALKRWYKEVDEYLTENNFKAILEQPARVFNLDETAFFLNPKGNKVLVLKGEKNVYQQVNADEKECLTVLVTGNANGELAPPLIVFKYTRIPQGLAESVPEHWGIGKSETGWMTGPLFFEFMSNIFHPFLVEKKIPLPVIVFIDGHASHLTLHTSKFCNEHGIILIALLPNSTHLIQPMDVAVFHVLKENWKQKVHQWRMNHLDQPVLKKIHFAPLLEETLVQSITPSILQNGFRKTGLVPWNPKAIDYSKIPSVNGDLIPAITNPSTPEVKRAGLEFLEKYIEKEKLASFQSSSDVWEGNVNDHSLFFTWKKIKDDCENSNNPQCLVETDLINGNQNKEVEEGISMADQNQNNEEEIVMANGDNVEIGMTDQNKNRPNEEGTGTVNQNNEKKEIVMADQSQNNEEEIGMAEQCVTPKNSIANPHVLQSPSSGGSTSSTSNNKLIPSPFKRALFWPENTEKVGKRRFKEKIPSVVTSKQWQEYHEKREESKLQKERLRVEKVEARRVKKEQNEIAKKLKTKEKIENRRLKSLQEKKNVSALRLRKRGRMD